jgi:hypothetical protein
MMTSWWPEPSPPLAKPPISRSIGHRPRCSSGLVIWRS